MNLLTTSIVCFFLFLGLFSCKSHKESTYPNGYEPTKITLSVLEQVKEKNLDHIPKAELFPGIVSSLLYQGSNTAGKEFSEHTVTVLDSISADIYHALSVQHLKNGNYSEAHKYISKAVKMDPKEHSGYYGWVLLYYYRDYPRALEYLNLFDDFTPNFSDFPVGENIHYLKGLAHLKMNQLDNAMTEFNTYIKEENDADAADFIDPSAYIHQGRIFAKREQYSEAMDCYKNAIELNDKCLEAYYFLAESQAKSDLLERALRNVVLAENLYRSNLKASDIYVELFHEIYLEDILELKKYIEVRIDK
jgi:tetratricopeptide (TPR) repeat protein